MKSQFNDTHRINKFIILFKGAPTIIKYVILLLYKLRLLELSFYVRAYVWHLTNRKPEKVTIMDVYDFFYISFLNIPPDKIEIVEKTENSIFTKCFHNCPIFNMAGILGKDTRVMCRSISKGPCEYFIRKLGKNITVDNEYYRIRPHFPKCEETITIVD